MKKVKIILFLFAIAFALTTCKKSSEDKCAGKSCLNGGVCNDGTCNCPGGYSGPNCETHDPCYGITCLHGGTCANGICNCPPGYGGSDCGTELQPTAVTVTSIDLTTYPVLGYDFSNGPDVFLSINTGTSANDYAFSGTYPDATGTTISFTTNFPYIFSSPNSNYAIGVWDYDTPDPDDFISGTYFIPNDFTSGHPSTITLNNGTITLVLHVTYTF